MGVFGRDDGVMSRHSGWQLLRTDQRRSGLTPLHFLAMTLLAVGWSLVAAGPSAAAAIDDVQQSAWGLATEGPSRAIDRYDALGWAVEEAGGRVFVGGKFLEVTNGQQTASQPHLAVFDLHTGIWIPEVRPSVGGPVLAIEPGPDGSLFVGGEIDTWNGQTIGALAKIDPATGQLWPGFTTRIYGGTSIIRDLSLGPDGLMYAAGTFTTASSSGTPGPVENVVRFDPCHGSNRLVVGPADRWRQPVGRQPVLHTRCRLPGGMGQRQERSDRGGPGQFRSRFGRVG